MKRAILLLSLFGFSAPLFAADNPTADVGYRDEITLDDGYSLVISKDTEETASVSILSQDKSYLYSSFTVGNAGFVTKSVQKLILDKKSKKPAYLVELYDKSSTYGAMTSVIVYENPWWEIAIIPDDQAYVKDLDGDGAYEIITRDNKILQFEAGMFKEKR